MVVNASTKGTPAMIARVIAKRLAPIYSSPTIEERLAFLDAKEKALAAPKHKTVRTPHFCSGCPHNSSTVVPEGSRAVAGIGCHYMVQWMDRETTGFTQMGGEGVNWVGEAPFSKRPHVFQNLGDGTYNHSGSLAIRAAKAREDDAAAPGGYSMAHASALYLIGPEGDWLRQYDYGMPAAEILADLQNRL